MSEQTNHVTSKDVRDAIVRRIELESEVTLGHVTHDVGQELGIDETVVRRQFNQLEDAELVYHDSDSLDADTEVRSP
jgi:predicted ArsR family transcriptional regulator